MIFATVGTQLPFPRMMRALDDLAMSLPEEVIAQTGPDARDYPHLRCHIALPPARFGALCRAARVIVGHAGIGTILTGQRLGRPVVIMPRRASLGEHRNDHQMATAHAVQGLTGVHIAQTSDDLARLLLCDRLEPASDKTPGPGRQALVGRIKAFVDG